MTAKQLYPDEFGEWPTYESGTARRALRRLALCGVPAGTRRRARRGHGAGRARGTPGEVVTEDLLTSVFKIEARVGVTDRGPLIDPSGPPTGDSNVGNADSVHTRRAHSPSNSVIAARQPSGIGCGSPAARS